MTRRWSLTDLPEWARQRERRMSLNDTILSSVARIIGDVSDPDHRHGQVRGVAGTGFLCGVPSRKVPGVRYGYVVTADHVIADQNAPQVQAPQPLSMGAALQPPIDIVDWRQPLEGVDLAIADFPGAVETHQGRLVYGGLATERHFLPPDWYPPLGGVVHYAGILEPEDRVMVRSGTLGALYQSGIVHPDGYVYDAHLADCRSYDGFSGSPCFAEIVMARLDPSDTVFPGVANAPDRDAPRGPLEYHALLCGMITWHLGHSRQQFASLYGVVAMVTSGDIWRALMSEKEQAERDEEDERYLADASKRGPKPQNLSVGGDDTETEFERFEELTRRLVNTSKPEKDGDPG